MAEIIRFLEPIPGPDPAGKYLRHDGLYDRIEEARRREDAATVRRQNLGRDAKTSDFKQVIQLGEEALLKQTKDLNVAAWLTEAWIYRDKLPGLIAGLELIQALIETFWDSVYPTIDEGDAGIRAKPLNWLGCSFDSFYALKTIALTGGKDKNGKNNREYTWLEYQEARSIGYEAEVKGSPDRVKERDLAIKEKRVLPEEFDRVFETTEKAFYKQLDAQCKLAASTLSSLERLCDAKFSADDAPSFGPFRKTLEDATNVVRVLLLKKLEKDPDPPEVVPEEIAAPADESEPVPEHGETPTVPPALNGSGAVSGEITSHDEAVLHVIAAAAFLRRSAPASPLSYLLLRSLRWGEIRAAPASTANLPAPASGVRTSLKMSAGAKNWKQVLEVAETAMSSPVGRGWLDLQRYTIKACDELGYTDAAKALRSELKVFLADFPQLSTAILDDDTGAANPETLAWLKQQNLIS